MNHVSCSTIVLALAGCFSACAPMPETRPRAAPVSADTPNESREAKPKADTAPAGEERLRDMEQRLGLDESASGDGQERTNEGKEGSDAHLESVGEPIEITCGDRDACRKEARRHCPLGYREVSREETAKPGWRGLRQGAGPGSDTPDASQPGAGSHQPKSAVPQTRLVIQCR